MTRDETRALIVRLHEIWSDGNVAAVPDIYAPDFVAHMPKGWGEEESRDGHDGIRRAIERLRAGFPDWCEHVQDILIDGDKAAVRYYSTGTNLGSFSGRAPTGRRIEVDELSIFRVANGRVAEQWCLNDDLAFGKQMRGENLVPP
jgi:predicted ester cyclase